MWKKSLLRWRWWLGLCLAAGIVAGAGVATPLLAQNATHSKWTLPEDAYGLTLDPSGNIWTTAFGDLYRLNPGTNQLTTYSHAVAFGTSYGAASDSSGNIWFTNRVSDQCRINKFDPTTRDIDSWTYTTSDCSGNYALAVDGSGDAWFGKLNAVARLTPGTDTITTWPLATTPCSLDVDSSGKVWLLECATNTVGLLDPGTNNLKEWPAPGTQVSTRPRAISVDGSDRAWFGAWNVFLDPETVNVIARLDAASNEMTKWVCPPGLCTKPGSVAADDPGGKVWFTEEGGGYQENYVYYVQRLDPAASPPEFTRWDVNHGPCPFAWQVAADGSGGAWFIFYEAYGWQGSPYNACRIGGGYEQPWLERLQPF